MPKHLRNSLLWSGAFGFGTAVLLAIAMAFYLTSHSLLNAEHFGVIVTFMVVWIVAFVIMSFIGFQLGLRGRLPGTHPPDDRS